MTVFIICTVLAVLAGYIMEEYFRDSGWEVVLFTVVMGVLMGKNEVVLRVSKLFANADPNTPYILSAALFTLTALIVSLCFAWVRAGKTDFGQTRRR